MGSYTRQSYRVLQLILLAAITSQTACERIPTVCENNPVADPAAAPFHMGSGNEVDPYVMCNQTQFIEFATNTAHWD
jgi:hypothetical protein